MAAKKIETDKQYFIVKGNEPMMVAHGAAVDSTVTTTRRNRATTIPRTDRFANIDQGVLPFRFSVGSQGREMDARDAITLCQKAYFNISIVRNIIDLMTEFSVGNIYFEDGNQASRDFFKAWCDKININSLQDRLYREYYRAGTVPIIRFEDSLQPGDVRKLVQTFGFTEARALDELSVEPSKIPVRYSILNPADLLYAGNLALGFGYYYKRLSDYELIRLRDPKTDEDLQVFNSLPADVKKQIKMRQAEVNLPLDPDKTNIIFYKKQDYEPFACPMIYPVLEDLNFKLELKKLDAAIARTQQQVILLVTTGAKPDEGGINPESLKALQQLLSNESVGRVLVADYTTKAEFVIPQIGEILTPSKYEQLDRDINMGLNNILIGGEKFANQSAKVEVFLARLNHGRDVFLREFLLPEMRRIAKSIGFKSFPTPYYEDIKLDDNDVRDRIYVQMAQLGLLAPNEVITALDSGRLPDPNTSLQNQKAYKDAKDQGLYQPIAPPQTDSSSSPSLSNPTGRPAGTPAPQLTKHVTPIGGSANPDTQLYSTTKLIETLKIAASLRKDVESALRKKFGKKQLTQAQKDVATEIVKIIACNEDLDNWATKVNHYCEKPVDTNPDRVNEILAIAAEHETDAYLASLLYVSKKDDK
jgi:hypothetical protein